MNYLTCHKQTAHPTHTISLYRLKDIVVLTALLSVCILHAGAQPHPGGGTHTNYYWFKADAGVTLNASKQITAWTDVASGETVPSYIAGGSVKQQDPSFNYNPALSLGFLIKNNFNKQSSTSGGSFFIVSQQNASQISDYRISPFSSGNLTPRQLPSGVFYWLRNMNTVVTGASNSYLYRPYIPYPNTTMIRNVHAYDTYLKVFFDQKGGTTAGISSTYTMNYVGLNFFAFFDGSSGPFALKGKIAESIIFLNPITETQRLKVTSYLALKYGISLRQDPANSYYSSDSNILMWDATEAGIYNRSIAGIGRDDSTDLHQIRSRSIIGNFVEISAENEGTNIAPAFTDMDNMEFLTWAHDSKGTNVINTGLPSQLAERIDRKWMVQEVGEVGTLQVDFYTNLIPGLSGKAMTDFTLIVDSDSIFSNGGTRLYPAAGYNSSTGRVIFSGVQLNNKEIFSLSTKRAPVKVEFMQLSTSEVEIGGTILPRLLLSEGAPLIAGSVEITLASIPGTATAGQDYAPNFSTPITVTIPAGDYNTPQNIGIPGLSILDDLIIEPSETIGLTLQNPLMNNVLGLQSSTTHTIRDNDRLTVSLDRTTGMDNESSGGNLPQIQLLGAITTSPLNVAIGGLAGAPGTALSGIDYLPNTTPIIMTIPPGDYTSIKTIPIPTLAITNDAIIEQDETFQLLIQNPSIPLLQGPQPSAVYTITNDDKLTVVFNQATGNDSESSGGNLPNLLVSGAISTAPSTVQVTLSGPPGTATKGTDYAPDFNSPITVNIPPGNYTTAKTIPIPTLAITNDAIIEANETIELILQNPSNSVVAGSQNTTVYTITNDDQLTVVFDQATGSDSEASGSNLPGLTVSGGISTAPLTVQVALSGTPGTATKGVDYAPDFSTPITMTIPADDYTTAKTIPIPTLAITNDGIVETDETIKLILQRSSNAFVLGSLDTTLYTITNDDKLTMAFNQATGNDSEALGGNLPGLTLSGGRSAIPLTVEMVLSGTPGTATKGVDYTPDFNSPLTVTIAPGDYRAPRIIPIQNLAITNDGIVEPDETIGLMIQNPSNEIMLEAQTTTVYTIKNDDKLTVAFAQATSNDNESSGGNLPGLAVSGGISTVPSTVEVALSGPPGTATKGVDYTPDFSIPITVNIPPGDYTTAKTIPMPTLAITNDAIIEADETIRLMLQNPSNTIGLGVQTTTVYTITNNDKLNVTFDQATGSDSEPSAGNRPSVTISGGISTVQLRVQLALSSTPGTATQGVDYSLSWLPGYLRIPADNYTTPKTISIPFFTITNDVLVEEDETIELVLQDPLNSFILGPQDTTVYTITDNDKLTVVFNQATGNDSESSGGNLPSIIVSGAISADPLTVQMVLSGTPGTATKGTDYTPDFNSPLTVTIPPGDYRAPRIIPIQNLAITNDGIVEPDETIGLRLQNSSNLIILGARDTTVYTIKNDDKLTVAFAQATSNDNESSGGNLPGLAVSGGISTVPSTVEVALSGPPGTATKGVDYTPDFSIPITVNIPPGDYTTAKTIPMPTLAITNDAIIEADETIRLKLQNPSNTIGLGVQTTTVYTITNNDKLNVTFDQATGSDSEPSAGNRPSVTISGGISTVQLRVQLALSSTPGTATQGVDYSLSWLPGYLRIPADNYTTPKTISIPFFTITNDVLVEQDETIELVLQDPLNSFILGPQDTTVYTITDDDKLTVVFNQATGNDSESSGGNLPSIIVSGAISADPLTVQMVLSGTPGTATKGTDYTPDFNSPITVNIPPGDYRAPRIIPIQNLAITNDGIVEPDETIRLMLQNSSNLIILGALDTTVYTITNDDKLTVAFAQATSNDNESSGGNLPALTVSGAISTAPLTVEVALSGIPGTATKGTDYTPDFNSPITVNIPLGDYTTAKIIPIPTLAIANDANIEPDETIGLRLQNPSNAFGLGAQTTTVYTITNDDKLTVTFNQATGNDNESSGGNLPGLTVSGAISTAPSTVEVALSGTPGTATKGTDYTPDFNSPLTVTIPPGDYTTAKTIPIPTLAIANDANIEPDETIELVLQNPSNEIGLGAQTTTVYTITNDDKLTVAFNQATGSDSEASGGNLPGITVNGDITSAPLTVKIVLSPSPGNATAGVDYTPNFSTPLTVSIPPGNYNTAKVLPISGLAIVNDSDLEDNETFSLTLQPPPSNIVLGPQATTVYTINNDDALPKATLTVSDLVIFENGGKSTIGVNISNRSFKDITVTLSFSGDLSSNEYKMLSNQIVIPAGSTSGSLLLTSLDDNIYEGDESLEVGIESITQGSEDGDQKAMITVKDNEPLPRITLSIDNSTIQEKGGTAVVMARTDLISKKDIQVMLLFAGQAARGTDYKVSAPTIIIPAGKTSGSLNVVALEDILYELDELTTVSISSVESGEPNGTQTVETTIKDSGTPPALSIRTDISSILEKDKGKAILTIELAAVSAYETTFELAVSGEVSDSDFTLSGNTFTIPAGQLSINVFFTAVDDIVQENTENALITLDKIVNAQIDVNQSTVTIRIEDDDLVIVSQGFSPNGDGINDVWHIGNINKYPKNRIRVYNRWGNLVYEAKEYNNLDRSFSGYANVSLVLGGNGLPDGTYFYLIDLGNGSKIMSGFVVIRR